MSSTNISKDKQLSIEILQVLEYASDPCFVLELVCCTLIKQDEQLSNKLHIALANTTTSLLEHKERRLNLAINNLNYMISYKKLLKLEPKSRISFLLDMCNSLFPNGKLEGASENTRLVFDETISTFKTVLKQDKITSIEQLLEDDWWQRRGKYVKVFTKENNLFEN